MSRVDGGASKDLITQLSFGIARDGMANPKLGMAQPAQHGGSRQNQHLLPSATAPINFAFLPGSVSARRDEFLFATARLAADVMVKDLRGLSFGLWRAQLHQYPQRIDLRTPRRFDQNRRRKRLQTEAFNSLFSRRSYRVAVTTQFTDLLATPSLDCVGGKDDGSVRREGQDDQSKQNTRGRDRAPGRSIKRPRVVLKAPLLRGADDSQASCDSAFAALKRRAEQGQFCALPSQLGKKGLKHYSQAQQFGGQCSHMEDFSGKGVFPEPTLSAVIFFKDQRPELDKVEYERRL